MSNITEETINRCSIRLGAFNSNSVDTLVRLLHHQDYCIQLTSAKNNLKEKFENLLTTKKDADPRYMFDDTPWTRIELAVVMAFKTKHLEENDDSNQTIRKLSINDELNIAYAFLLAQINDRLSLSHVKDLMFLLDLKGKADNLFHVYENSSQNFSNFCASLLHSEYFRKNLVIADEIIRKFQSFIERYEDFLITYDQFYKSTPEIKNDRASFDAMMKNNDNQQVFIPASTLLPSIHEKPKPLISVPIKQSPKVSASPVIPQQQTPISSSSLFVPRKGLCVIINIQAFVTSDTFQTSYRAGSDKDVDVIKVIFNKLGFTVLQCNFDFKKIHLDQALDHVDDKNHFGQFDCLVMFIMSHGLLNSFLTSDHKIVVIRDIIKRYSDSSPSTNWAGKSRLFFIQACRSNWPDHMRPCDGEEVKQNDLSPRMLVAYSCSPSEASKRSPTNGSIFIQIFCVMLLHYGHSSQIQNILRRTAEFVIKRDEYEIANDRENKSIQKPEFLTSDFNTNFRFAKNCLFHTYSTWSYREKITLDNSLRIWEEYRVRIYPFAIGNRQ
ncbi:hypothetical protein I4U23_006608 [Adineta vaga]|nr:hypothetical protein I4U23_006608 [Adineta vaga]